MNESQSAETESLALPPPAEAAKLARLRNAAHFWRKMYYAFALTPVVCYLALAGWIELCEFRYIAKPPLWFLESAGMSGILWALTVIPASQWRKAVKAGQNGTDKQAVGQIVEGLFIKSQIDFAQEMLTGLLPRLQISDVNLLSLRHHSILNRHLDGAWGSLTASRANFVLAILKAYEQVGGAQDLLTVERLAQGKGYAKRNKEIREAAQDCLPYLQARADGQELRQTLLRASSESGDNSGTLLRPAHAANITDPAQLLRASEAAGENLS